MKKLSFVFVLAAVVVAVAGVSWAAEKGPIKVGWLSPHTGQWAEVGKDMNNGFNMFMEEIGYKVAGRTIEVIR